MTPEASPSTPESTAPVTPPPVRVSIAPTITRITQGIIVCSVIGILTSVFTLYAKHTGRGLCDAWERFNCMSLRSDPYTQLGGISIGYIALIVFLAAAVAAWQIRKPPVLGQRGKYSHQQVLKFIRGVAVIGTLWVFYLAYVETFVLQAWCVLCLVQQGLILAILILSFTALGTIADDMREQNVCEFC